MAARILPTLLLGLVAAPSVLATTCNGAMNDGYCCDGSIIMKNDNSDFSAANFICCEGDPNLAVFGNGGPSSCTAGTAVPLTEASDNGGASQATSTSTGTTIESGNNPTSSAGAAEATSTSSNGAMLAVITAPQMIGLAAALGGAVLGL